MNPSQTEKKQELTEYRHNRNWVRLGDQVRCKPLQGSSFVASVRRIIQTPTGIEVEVIDPRTHHFRTFTIQRIVRKAQSRAA
jgi:hypothetical protein